MSQQLKPSEPERPENAASARQPDAFTRLLSIRQAAQATNLNYWLLLRAVNNGDIPAYQFGNKRRRVRLGDIEAALTRTIGGRAA